MKDRTVRLKVESLHVEDPAITRLHQNRNGPFAGRFANQELDVEGIAFLDDEVQAVDEGRQVLGRDALGERRYREVRINLGHATREHDRLIDAEVHDAGGDAVEIRQFDLVEVRQTQLADDSLHCQYV